MDIKFSHSEKKKSGTRVFIFEGIIDEHSIYFNTLNGDFISLKFYNNVNHLARLFLEVILQKDFIQQEIKKEVDKVIKEEKIKRLKK